MPSDDGKPFSALSFVIAVMRYETGTVMSDSEHASAIERAARARGALGRGAGERLGTARPADPEHPALLQRLLDELARQDRAAISEQTAESAQPATNH